MHSRPIRRSSVQGVLVALLVAISPFAACGDETPEPDAAASPVVDLAVKQGQLADKYKRLEAMMLKMAEYDASDNPRRSALLKQALAKSKDRHIALQMETLVKLFQQEQLQRAMDNQSGVRADLQVLLDLLLSENRPDRLQNEQARLRRYIKELDRIIRIQKAVQGRTEGGDNVKKLAQEQEQVARRTGQLGKEIDETERTEQPQSSEDGPDADSRQQDGSSDGQKPSRPGDGTEPSENEKTYSVITKDGKVVEGKIVERTDDGIVVETEDGERVAIKDENVEEIKAGGQEGKAKASKAKVSKAKVNKAKVNKAKVNKAKVNKAKVNKAKVNKAKVNKAKVNKAKVNKAKVNKAKVNKAKVNKAKVSKAKVSKAKVSKAKANNRSNRIHSPVVSVSRRRRRKCVKPINAWKKLDARRRCRSRKRPDVCSSRQRPSWKRFCVSFAKKKSSVSWRCSKADSAKCSKCSSKCTTIHCV